MKYKAKTKEHRLFVTLKITHGEKLDEKELDRFSRLFLRGFLKPKLLKKNVVEYTGPVGISLYERLKRPMPKRDFLLLMEQIVVCVQKLAANNLSITNLVMDTKQAYINEVTKEVSFIYIPCTERKQQGSNLIAFIENIVYSVTPCDEEDNEFVSRFVYFFKSMKPFNIDKIEGFIASEDKNIVKIIRKQNSGQSGFMTNKPQHYYDYYEENNKSQDDATGLLENDDPTGLLSEDEPTGLLSSDDEATGLLNNEDEATGLLADDGEEATGLLIENNVNVKYATLVRVLTEETISVNKPVFRLGKEKSYVDYFVTNNVAVSRSHADIITRGNKYFVKDLNSKNRTYINNQEIPVHMEIEIRNGDRLKLGNEEFIFNV